MAYSMNSNWYDFLSTQGAVFEKDDLLFPLSTTSKQRLYAIKHLAILQVNGKDSAQLLQGQATCQINDIVENKFSFGAFCTPQGKTISSFLITKQQDSFLLILPTELLEKIQKRLQLYILRADVQLTDCRETLCLLGFYDLDKPPTLGVSLLKQTKRSLLICDTETAIQHWQNSAFTPCPTNEWAYLDALAGIPWLNTETTEEFIPQMLNIDKLGGISFNKGCYTGQEIVARTHYLGKAKRQLYWGEVESSPAPIRLQSVMNQQQSVGKIISIFRVNKTYQFLMVLAIDHENSLLTLDEANCRPIKLSHFHE